MNEFSPGLAGVVAFETEIAEPDKDGGELRYRGVDIEDLVGTSRSSRCGACSSTSRSSRACRPRTASSSYRTGGHMSDLQAALAALSGKWKLGQLIDIDDDAGEGGPAPPVGGRALDRRAVRARRGQAARAARRRCSRARPRPSASCSRGAAR